MRLKEQGGWTRGLVLRVRRVRVTLEPAMEPKGTRERQNPSQRQPQSQRHAAMSIMRINSALPDGSVPYEVPKGATVGGCCTMSAAGRQAGKMERAPRTEGLP